MSGPNMDTSGNNASQQSSAGASQQSSAGASQQSSAGASQQSSQDNASQQASQASNGPWYSSLPETLREDPNITKFQSVEAMAQGYVNAASMIGRDKIPMPKTDAEWSETYDRLGRPKDYSEYKIPDMGVEFDQRFYPAETMKMDQEAYRACAHKYGLSDTQFQGLYKEVMQREHEKIGQISIAVDNEVHRSMGTLRAKWGESYDANIKIADRAMLNLFGKDGYESMNGMGFGRNVQFIEAMYKQGSKSLEELGIDRHGSSTRTPGQLRNELAAIQTHPAYFDGTHPEHRQKYEEAFALQERLFAGK